MQRLKLSIIGTGNVAFHLGHLLHKSGFQFSEVYGRSTDKALELARGLKCNVVDSISKLSGDLILVCVNDDSIPSVLAKLPTEKIVIYTSGSMHLQKCGRNNHTGVLYPLQTLQKEKPVPSALPLLIEAQDDHLLSQIKFIASKISNQVFEVNSDDRLTYHLSAVWLNNFTNHIVYLSQNLLKEHHLSFELLKPLLDETLAKLKQGIPEQTQTGPARRGDQRIIDLHSSLLTGRDKHLYELISESIKDTYRKDDQL